MPLLNALKKAPILNEAGATLDGKYTVTTTDPAVVKVGTVSPGYWYATGVAAGTATITAKRTLDGATASLDVEVVAAVPFSISLGAESPA